MENVYQLIEKYVKLTYIVKVLTGHCSKSADFNTSFSNIDFSQLGLSDDILKIIGPNPDVNRLKAYISVFERLADMASMEVFGPLSKLDYEEKLQIKDYLEDRVSTYLTSINTYQETYLGIVFEIDEAGREDNKDKVNIKYRLKENGKYIIGEDDWVYYDQIVLENIILNSKEADSYQLEWMWVSENNELETWINF